MKNDIAMRLDWWPLLTEALQKPGVQRTLKISWAKEVAENNPPPPPRHVLAHW